MKKLWSLDYIRVKDNIKELVTLFYLLGLLLLGLVMQAPSELLEGLKTILTTEGLLISDYMEIGGVGPTLVNGSIVGLIGYSLVKLSKVTFNGPILAALFTMVGFGFFGKNIYSVLPIIAGVFVYSRIRKESFKTFLLPALFGTALAPLVTQIIFGFGWGVLPGVFFGILAGIIVPPLASHLLKTHNGFNIYNIGFTAGFVGLLFTSILRSFGHDSQAVLYWGEDFNTISIAIFGTMFISMIIIGIALNKGKLRDYLEIVKHPGTLATDFVSLGGFANSLMNMGFVGVIGISYVLMVGGDLNGPTIGGLMTMVGFAAFGKHPKNITPIMLGVFLGTLVTSFEANQPGPILAALFGTTLAPLAGQYGPAIGVLAGFVHLSVVTNVGVLHGGVNLYNNGFSGGFVAIIFVALLGAFKNNR
ncbi:DUF1576 domain-containing protein [Proteinivorax hydrogeniformans]|uniref:DUF1576 domain-containing protein n=1 Tax=Proteinivorax hydrogeniformans TaxID=1826727 RepID=A0AAU8HSE8_9FIRM